MEYMEGGSLKEASSSFTFQEPHIAYIAREVCYLSKIFPIDINYILDIKSS